METDSNRPFDVTPHNSSRHPIETRVYYEIKILLELKLKIIGEEFYPVSNS